MNKAKILYLHGLESPQGGEKVDFLSKKAFVHAPEVDYTRNDIFPFLIQIVEDFKPDLIIGSSMGGYAAYILGSLYKISVLAYNPAVQGRKFNPNFPEFSKYHTPDNITIVIGEKDNIINGQRTLDWLKDHIGSKYMDCKIERIKDMGHRVPLNIFIDMYNKTIK
jgi:hypothetical protein